MPENEPIEDDRDRAQDRMFDAIRRGNYESARRHHVTLCRLDAECSSRRRALPARECAL